MTLLEFKDILLEKAIEMGCTAAEVFCSESENFSVSVENQSIEKYKVSQNRTLSLRVVYKGQDGFAGTEIYDDAEELIRNAMDNASIVTSVDTHPMQRACEYENLPQPKQPLANMTESQCIDLAMKLEKAILDYDSRVKRTMGVTIGVTKQSFLLANTLGLEAQDQDVLSYTSTSVVMDNDGEEINGYGFKPFEQAIDIDMLASEVVKECAEKLNASPVEVGEYKVLFTNKCFCDMLELYESIFSAYAALKGLSQLKDKEGQQIASELVTICDDPHNSFYPIPFDLEGTPTQYKNLVENGKLITLLHSLKTAELAGVASTGNGTRTGSCMTTNFYLKPGTMSFEELTKGERILVISEVDGGGTGVNTVSGEFSLSARGVLYENGVRIKAVNQITIAGNFYDLLKDVEAVGNDLVFNNMAGMGFIGSPCVLVGKLNIAG